MDEKTVGCGNCLYARETRVGNELKTRLACHRYPPQYVLFGNIAQAMNPIVEPVNFCGEFTEKPQELDS